MKRELKLAAAIGSIYLTGQSIASAAPTTAVTNGLILQVTATDYQTQFVNNVLTPDVGPTMSVIGDTPTIITNATPNGAATIGFDGAASFGFSSTIGASTQTFTIVGYINDTATSGDHGLTGGPRGSFEYRISGTGANALQEFEDFNVADEAAATVGIGTGFKSIDSTYDATNNVTSFRQNGATAGNNQKQNPLATFGAVGIARFGSSQDPNGGGGSNEFFQGDVSEFRIYNRVLTTTEMATVEAELTAKYVTPVPEPASIGLLGVAGMGLLARRRRTA